MKSLESYSITDPEVVENPFEYYKLLREQAPVYQMPGGGLLGVLRNRVRNSA